MTAPVDATTRRAVLLTSSPELAERIIALDPRIKVTLLHQLPGTGQSRIPVNSGLLLLVHPEPSRVALPASTYRTYYVSTGVGEDTAIRARALHADAAFELPRDCRRLQNTVARQIAA